MINITVIGFGYVGSSLSLLLLNSKHPIRLNVMEPSPECQGAFLDLAHAVPLFKNKALHLNDEDLFAHADFIYYAAGTPNLHGGSRLSTAKENIRLSKEIFEPRTFVHQPYIIVITNPVDIVTQAVQRFSGLPHERVIGTGTFLDSIRLEYYLSQLSGIPISDIQAIVVGEHGDSQVPLYSMSKVKGTPLLDHPFFTAEQLTKASILTRDAAFHIRETQGGTTYGISKCAEALLDYLLDQEEEHFITLSVITNSHYRNLLNLNRDIYIGLPVSIYYGNIRLIDNIKISDLELDGFRKTAKVLSKII